MLLDLARDMFDFCYPPRCVGCDGSPDSHRRGGIMLCGASWIAVALGAGIPSLKKAPSRKSQIFRSSEALKLIATQGN